MQPIRLSACAYPPCRRGSGASRRRSAPRRAAARRSCAGVAKWHVARAALRRIARRRARLQVEQPRDERRHVVDEHRARLLPLPPVRELQHELERDPREEHRHHAARVARLRVEVGGHHDGRRAEQRDEPGGAEEHAVHQARERRVPVAAAARLRRDHLLIARLDAHAHAHPLADREIVDRADVGRRGGRRERRARREREDRRVADGFVRVGEVEHGLSLRGASVGFCGADASNWLAARSSRRGARGWPCSSCRQLARRGARRAASPRCCRRTPWASCSTS